MIKPKTFHTKYEIHVEI